MGRLGTPRFQDGVWRQNSAMDLAPGPLLLFWTGHSPRHFLTQAAASLGVDKTRRDFLGRWAIGRTGSNAYLHTSRQVVEEIQQLVLESIRTGKLDESELLEDLVQFADKHELLGQRVRRRHNHDYTREHVDNTLDTVDSDADEGQPQEKEQVLEAMRKHADDENQTHGYFVTTSRRTGFRRLHMHGRCPVRSERCIDTMDVPDVNGAAFDAVCKICQRRITEELGRTTNAAEASSDSGDSSSTDSTDEEQDDEAGQG